MNIIVKEELRAYIDPLSPDEYASLERSILAEGCRDALVLWGDVLVDGHNRHGICQKHGIPFNTVQHPHFKSMDDVHLWMIDQHLGRRSVSDFQRGVLALRKKDILAARGQASAAPSGEAMAAAAQPLQGREAIARAARISSSTVSQIEKIQKAAAPELVAAVKAGEISINAAAAVASLPVAEQVVAVAGGKKELQLAARQVRQARAQARAEAHAEAVSEMPQPPVAPAEPLGAQAESPDDRIARLNQTIAALQAENAQLKARLAELGQVVKASAPQEAPWA